MVAASNTRSTTQDTLKHTVETEHMCVFTTCHDNASTLHAQDRQARRTQPRKLHWIAQQLNVRPHSCGTSGVSLCDHP